MALAHMTDEDKRNEFNIRFPGIDLPKTAAEEDEDAAAKDRALVPFDPQQRYLTEIRRFPLLSREEEHRLAVEYKEYGNVEAAYKLVTANLRLVVMIAREYQKAFKTLLDLIQEGNMGLMEAVKNFDPYRGVRFPSYVHPLGRRKWGEWMMAISTLFSENWLLAASATRFCWVQASWGQEATPYAKYDQ